MTLRNLNKGVTNFGGGTIGSGAPVRKMGPQLGRNDLLNAPQPQGDREKAEGLSPETMEGLKAFMDANKEKVAPEVKVEGPTGEKDVAVPGDTNDKGQPEKEVTEEPQDFTFNASPLASPKRRKQIESRCKDMSFEDLIINKESRQVVPIIPEKLVIEYRTHEAHEDFFIKEKIADATDKGKSRSYVLDLFALYNLALDVVSINGKPIASHLDADGKVVPDAFEKKLKHFERYPTVLLNDLSINLNWFQERVQKLLTPDNIKNG